MTMRLRILPRAVVAAILVALPVGASAPADQYDRFDRTTPTIVDHYTKLEWDRFKTATSISFNAAIVTCPSIFSGGTPGRLPTIKELLTILDEQPHEEYEQGLVTKMIDGTAFNQTPVSQPYWSSTPAPGGLFWALSFSDGSMVALPAATPAAMRCVR